MTTLLLLAVAAQLKGNLRSGKGPCLSGAYPSPPEQAWDLLAACQGDLMEPRMRQSRAQTSPRFASPGPSTLGFAARRCNGDGGRVKRR